MVLYEKLCSHSFAGEKRRTKGSTGRSVAQWAQHLIELHAEIRAFMLLRGTCEPVPADIGVVQRELPYRPIQLLTKFSCCRAELSGYIELNAGS